MSIFNNEPEMEEAEGGSVRILNNVTLGYNTGIETENVDEFLSMLALMNNSLQKTAIDYPTYRPEINLLFSTMGGSVYDAFRMFDGIIGNPIPVNIYATGIVASSGLIVLLAGKKRYTYQNTQFLYHQISGGMTGTHQQLKGHYYHAKSLSEFIDNLITTNTKLTSSELQKMSLEEHWFDAKTAVDYGFVDETTKKSVL